MDKNNQSETVKECFAIYLSIFDKKILAELCKDNENFATMDIYTIRSKIQILYMRYIAFEKIEDRVKIAYEHMMNIVDHYIDELEHGVETRIKELAKRNADMSKELDIYKDSIFFESPLANANASANADANASPKKAKGWSSFLYKKI